MKLVADANVLFALSKPSSAANDIWKFHHPQLVAPDFALVELYRHKRELLEKSGEKSFHDVVASLRAKVVFVELSEYAAELKSLSGKISDPKDMVYLALALRLKAPIWSNDKHFGGQSVVDVFTTKQLVQFLGEPPL